MTEQKRKYKRIKKDFDVQLRIKNAGIYSDKITTETSINVSATGVLFKLDRPIEIGSVVKLKFIKPGDFFEGDAQVVRLEACPEDENYDIGVQFSGLSETDEIRLDNYLLKSHEE